MRQRLNLIILIPPVQRWLQQECHSIFFSNPSQPPSPIQDVTDLPPDAKRWSKRPTQSLCVWLSGRSRRIETRLQHLARLLGRGQGLLGGGVLERFPTAGRALLSCLCCGGIMEFKGVFHLEPCCVRSGTFEVP